MVAHIAILLIGTLTVVVTGCDEKTLRPESRGVLRGTVENAETNAPIARANVTTSPPTASVLTTEDGTFSIPDIPTGNYTITASKSEFDSRSVTVRVEEEKTTTATILLGPDQEHDSESDSLMARVTNWFNDPVNRDSTGRDSIFVDVEYRVKNVGEVPIRRFEVYFEIASSEGPFSYEVSGDSLQVRQVDVGGFRKYIPVQGQEVRIDGVFFEPKD